MNRWIPKAGETVTVRGDGDNTRTITGEVLAVSKSGCGMGMVRLDLRGTSGDILADKNHLTIAQPANKNLGLCPKCGGIFDRIYFNKRLVRRECKVCGHTKKVARKKATA